MIINKIMESKMESKTESKTVDEYRMIFVIDNSLKMKKGKVAAQCAHAAIGLYKHANIFAKSAVKQWEKESYAKITCKGDNEEHLILLQELACSKNICTHLVVDAGRTQIEPGSKTVLAIGPALKSELDAITGDLKLY
jgi:peptidyl-tRNA hydrolase, PTH2 family